MKLSNRQYSLGAIALSLLFTPISLPASAQPANNYPLRMEQGSVGDSRRWVRVNGWLLNVEEWNERDGQMVAVELAGFRNFCKKTVEIDGTPHEILFHLRYNTTNGTPRLISYSPKDSNFDVGEFIEQTSFPAAWVKPLHELVPPQATPSSLPLQIKTENEQRFVLVNGQEIPIKEEITTPDGRVLYALDLFYALAEREYTVDNGQNKRRVFYSVTDGNPYEVILKYNGNFIRSAPLTSSKNLVDLIPFTYFPPGSGYGLRENARGYRQGGDFTRDPLSLEENRPQCPF